MSDGIVEAGSLDNFIDQLQQAKAEAIALADQLTHVFLSAAA